MTALGGCSGGSGGGGPCSGGVPSKITDAVGTEDGSVVVDTGQFDNLADGYTEEGEYRTNPTVVYEGSTGAGAVRDTDTNEVRMAVDRDLEPNDGEVNVYPLSLELTDEKKWQMTAFVDEDFKSFADSDLNVAWGEDWGNFRSFCFDEVVDNVYADTVTATAYNFAVGTFSKADVENERYRNIDAAVFLT